MTGGASGIGYAFVNHFLKFGAKMICVVDVDRAAGERTAIGFEKKYGEGKIIFLEADVSKPEISGAVQDASTIMDGIDILVNNAGILDERKWEREIAVNVSGMLTTAVLAMDCMSKSKGGRGGILVNVSQHIRMTNTAQLPVYAATKHAVIGLSQSLSSQSDKTGVRMITLCPGLTDTTLTLDSPNKLLSRVMKADFVKNLNELSIQTPHVVAQGLMSILRNGKSGSVWVVEDGRAPYEVTIPDPRALRRHYRNDFTCNESPKRLTRGRPIRVYDVVRAGLASCA